MRLVIKGKPKTAKRAAARHGVPVRNCTPHPKFAETFCDAPESARTKVMYWYAERNTGVAVRGGRGFTPGTLTFFNGGRRRRRKRR